MWQLSCSLCDDVELPGISEDSLYSCAVLHGVCHHLLEIINGAEGGVVTWHTPCCIQQLQQLNSWYNEIKIRIYPVIRINLLNNPFAAVWSYSPHGYPGELISGGRWFVVPYSSQPRYHLSLVFLREVELVNHHTNNQDKAKPRLTTQRWHSSTKVSLFYLEHSTAISWRPCTFRTVLANCLRILFQNF